MRYPLIRPNPPRLSTLTSELEALEASGMFSNRGPIVRRFETELVERFFAGQGACATVANATLGLMLAIRLAAVGRKSAGLALMPSFTFAATAQAALWAGLKPLICDVGGDDWCADPAAEERLLAAHRKKISAIVPYATFGAPIDLDRYAWLSARHDVGIVVDAAASLGTLDELGRNFGTGSRLAVVFSMHATKSFAVAEAGVVYSADPELIAAIRQMSNFGFGEGRSAVGIGLNAKLPEVLGVMALAKLETFDAVSRHRSLLEKTYRTRLAARFQMQRSCAVRQAPQFMPVLLPPEIAGRRAELVTALAESGIGAGKYFSPHLAQQPFFRESCALTPTPVADDIAARILSLPLTDDMTVEDVAHICARLEAICAGMTAPSCVSAAATALMEIR